MATSRAGSVSCPEKVSDISITRLFEVECGDHGVIDACRTYSGAVASRREHWFEVHNAGRPEGGEPA